MWVDTHAHLSDAKFDQDRDAVVERAIKAGVTYLVEIADGPDEWPKAQSLAEKHAAHMSWAAGLHPYHADQSTPDLWKRLETIAVHPQFVAIGEIGLDYAKCPIPRDVQIATFRAGIELSLKIKKPMVIHCREAYADLLPVLSSYFPKSKSNVSPGVVHCFSGNAENAQALIEMGFYLGVDGPITYPSAKPLREALMGVPLENLVLETDSPYLPPQTHRGQRNEPLHIPQIGFSLAHLREISTDDLARKTAANSFLLFRVKPA